MIRQRRPAEPSSTPAAVTSTPRVIVTGNEKGTPSSAPEKMESGSHQSSQEQRPLLGGDVADTQQTDQTSTADMGWIRQNQWVVLAIASGACAAFNGVFAKLYVQRSFLSMNSSFPLRRLRTAKHSAQLLPSVERTDGRDRETTPEPWAELFVC